MRGKNQREKRIIASNNGSLETSSQTQSDNSKKCRICLEEGDIAIFQESSQNHNILAENIEKFGEIKMSADDGLPHYICQRCDSLLNCAVLFRVLSQQSDRALRLQEPNKRENAEESFDDVTQSGPDDAYEGDNNNTKQHKLLFQCKKCQMGFNSAELLKAHRATPGHQAASRPLAQCPHCPVRVCRGSLAAHIARKHTATHQHICHICAKNFAVKGSLERHLLIHTDELPFQCASCPYRCRYKASLVVHTRGHTGEKPYNCPTCPAAFPSASNLRKHSRIHLLTHTLKCEHCDKGFHTAHKMKAHIKVEHLGLREYECELCCKHFGYKQKLSQHMKNVHKKEKRRSGREPLYLQIQKRNQSKISSQCRLLVRTSDSCDSTFDCNSYSHVMPQG